MKDKFYECEMEKKYIKSQQAICAIKFRKANKLNINIDSIKNRWQDNINKQKQYLKRMHIPLLLREAVVEFFGPFDNKTREFIFNEWKQIFHKELQKHSLTYKFPMDLFDLGIEMYQRVEQGLPDDKYCIENFLICQNSRKLPVI